MNYDEANRLYDVLKHGDVVHRWWLRAAIKAFVDGKPAPPPRSSPDVLISAATTKAAVARAMRLGRVILVPDINHCQECEFAYDNGLRSPIDHPVVLELKR